MDTPEQVSLPLLQNTMGWESKAPLPGLTGLGTLIREFQMHQTHEATVASILILPSPGMTQKLLITPSIVLTHTGPYCVLSTTERGL